MIAGKSKHFTLRTPKAGRFPRTVGAGRSAVLAVSLVGIHILWNARTFYRKVAPKCPTCNSAMNDVDGLMMIMGVQHVERPTPIHCNHCENVIVFWDDVRQPGKAGA